MINLGVDDMRRTKEREANDLKRKNKRVNRQESYNIEVDEGDLFEVAGDWIEQQRRLQLHS